MDEAVKYIKNVLFAGYSLEEISKATKYERSTIAKVFSRGRHFGPEFLLRCALAAGAPPDKLFELGGHPELAMRFRSAYPPESLQGDERLLRRIRLLLDCGLARQLEAQVKQTEERLMGLQANFPKAAAACGAEAGFVAVDDRIAALWSLSREEASQVASGPLGEWRKYGEGLCHIYLKKPQRLLAPLLQILREFE